MMRSVDRAHTGARQRMSSSPARLGSVLFIALGLLATAGFHDSHPPALSRPIWHIVWRQEFNGTAGAPVDHRQWTAETGGGGWGNQEYEYYTDGARNAHLDGKGDLAISARKETPPDSICWYGRCRYTSARLITKDHFTQKYGRFEARIKVPSGIGYWPAFWMLGDDIDAAGWPSCGEIDIMENVGQEPSLVHGSAHGPGYSGGDALTEQYQLPDERRFADGFHIFAVEWEPTAIRWYVDSTLYETRTPADLPSGASWVYQHPFFLLLNVAIGGSWPGDPLPSTAFPQSMLVDYVRVYQRASPSSPR